MALNKKYLATAFGNILKVCIAHNICYYINNKICLCDKALQGEKE